MFRYSSKRSGWLKCAKLFERATWLPQLELHLKRLAVMWTSRCGYGWRCVRPVWCVCAVCATFAVSAVCAVCARVVLRVRCV
eukprot:1343407-Pyramimonas_sp.AAC.1